MTAWITLGWAATAGSFIGLSGIAGWMRRRSRRTIDTEGDIEGETEGFAAQIHFSLERYKPMERLLAADEFLFLTQMPGYRPEIGKRWKCERRRIFRMYLNELGTDFQTLHRRARTLIAESPEAGSVTVGLLVRQKYTFWRAMAITDIRLSLEGMGIGAVDPRPLLELVEAMRMDVDRLASPDRLNSFA